MRAPDQPIVGSGPYAVSEFADGRLTLLKFDKYIGYSPARVGHPRLPDRPQTRPRIEDAMKKGQVDAVWRGLNAAAVTRYAGQVDPERRQADAPPASR